MAGFDRPLTTVVSGERTTDPELGCSANRRPLTGKGSFRRDTLDDGAGPGMRYRAKVACRFVSRGFQDRRPADWRSLRAVRNDCGANASDESASRWVVKELRWVVSSRVKLR